MKDCSSNTNYSVSVFPNPLQSELTIHLHSASHATAYICNSQGSKMLSQLITEAKNTIDVSMLQTGIYILYVVDSELQTIHVQKLVR
jgi:hypothetical protein